MEIADSRTRAIVLGCTRLLLENGEIVTMWRMITAKAWHGMIEQSLDSVEQAIACIVMIFELSSAGYSAIALANSDRMREIVASQFLRI
uniref:Uncharacterized protein n=1 Tax=viral metagenome TaxID=1070528 RepID=A0A6C0LXU8_9ZZZZ